ncbi:GD14995 [Drosophila simulans]|uniref:GD14995 n=1 Tax=Drosophila simulans TaxID=7240 RepID=B4NVV7_DROSI|nr:GD14995 [Drosophila simulans]
MPHALVSTRTQYIPCGLGNALTVLKANYQLTTYGMSCCLTGFKDVEPECIETPYTRSDIDVTTRQRCRVYVGYVRHYQRYDLCSALALVLCVRSSAGTQSTQDRTEDNLVETASGKETEAASSHRSFTRIDDAEQLVSELRVISAQNKKIILKVKGDNWRRFVDKDDPWGKSLGFAVARKGQPISVVFAHYVTWHDCASYNPVAEGGKLSKRELSSWGMK